MTIKDFIEYVKENNIPEDYEIEIKYFDDGDYSYGYHNTGTYDYIAEVNDKEKFISLEI